MRILVVDFGYANLNPTVQSWKLPWKLLGDVDLFGPGISSDSEWSDGLAAYLRKHGSYDVIVLSEMFLQSTLSSQSVVDRAWTIRRSYWSPFDVERTLSVCGQVIDDWQSANAIKIVSMLEFDSYNMTDEHREVLTQTDAFVVGWGTQFIQERAHIKGLADERFADRVNDNWKRFVSEQFDRVISLPAFIAESDFSWSPLGVRRHDFALQGARYAARRQMKQKLRRFRKPYAGRWQPWLVAGMTRVWPDALSSPRIQAALRFEWEYTYQTSKVAFACGSRLGFPLRKFFEIPAAGAVLLAEPCNGFEDLGFLHRENCLDVRRTDLLELLSSDLDRLQALADNGRDLVWRLHSVHARSGQYRHTIEAISSGNFGGSRWTKGMYVVDERWPS